MRKLQAGFSHTQVDFGFAYKMTWRISNCNLFRLGRALWHPEYLPQHRETGPPLIGSRICVQVWPCMDGCKNDIFPQLWRPDGAWAWPPRLSAPDGHEEGPATRAELPPRPKLPRHSRGKYDCIFWFLDQGVLVNFWIFFVIMNPTKSTKHYFNNVVMQ